MKKLLYVPILLLFVACSGDPQRDTINTLIGLNQSIATAARVAEHALRQGDITIKQACQVEQYGRLAQDAVSSAYLNFGLGQPEATEDYIQAAKNILSRTSMKAAVLVEDRCAGD